ncbi:MAG: VanW family protein [Actinobacteria bacterium]|nr:VanW family protein [Actinomycetota bacterium]
MSGPFMSVANRPRRRARRSLRVLLGALALVALLLGARGAIALAERGSLPRGTTIGGVPVGGLSEHEAGVRVEAAAARRVARPIRLVTPGGPGFTRGRELRARPELGAALERAAEGGTTLRTLARLGLQDGPDVELTYMLAPVPAARLGNRLDARFGDPARDGRVVVTPEAILVTEARAGTAVDRRALRRALRTLPETIRLSVVSSRPVVSTAEARAGAAHVERLLDGPRRVRFRETQATLTPARLRSLVRTERSAGSLVVVLDQKGLGASLRVRLGVHEVAPRDATFAVGARRVRVVPSRPGRGLDVARIGRSLTKNLSSTTHRAWFTRSPAAFTTKAAERLDIRELVAEFTTYYSCCQPRVTNIKRAAELLDGTIVMPRTGFSLNEALGRRTEENGFVSAPQIYRGRLEDAVGGGISQIATTLYNAAFFAGLKLVAHQAHQFYISRYPMGREATVSWGGPELIFRNDWPAALLMKFIATDSGITVRFYSRKLGRRVVTETGEPYSYVAPRTITVRNSALPAGTTSTVQSAGASGFTVQYTREVYKGADVIKDERYTVRYDAQNAIVEVGPPKPRAKRPPKPPPEPPADEPPAPTE